MTKSGLYPTYLVFDAEGQSWSTEDPAEAAEWAGSREPVFVRLEDRFRKRTIGGVWTPQPACPTSVEALASIVERLARTLEAAR